MKHRGNEPIGDGRWLMRDERRFQATRRREHECARRACLEMPTHVRRRLEFPRRDRLNQVGDFPAF